MKIVTSVIQKLIEQNKKLDPQAKVVFQQSLYQISTPDEEQRMDQSKRCVAKAETKEETNCPKKIISNAKKELLGNHDNQSIITFEKNYAKNHYKKKERKMLDKTYYFLNLFKTDEIAHNFG